jgi:phosphonoacetate hydrolase
MNHKTLCWDLEKACAKRGTPIRIAISAERDKYPRHHRGHGGVSWVYCNRSQDLDAVSKTLSGLKGVEAILTRSEASRRYHLMASRIGDLVVLGDRETVFGDLESQSEALPPEYRSHGSLHEMDVPLIIYNAQGRHNAQARLSPEDFQYNWQLTRWLYS